MFVCLDMKKHRKAASFEGRVLGSKEGLGSATARKMTTLLTTQRQATGLAYWHLAHAPSLPGHSSHNPLNGEGRAQRLFSSSNIDNY